MKNPSARSLRIAILDSDPYSRSWIASLLMRDWRTRIIAELDTYAQLKTMLAQSLMPVDFVIADLDNKAENYTLPAVLSLIQKNYRKTKVIAIAQETNEETLRLFSSPAFCGYLLKSEAQISLAWAARQCSEGSMVITPGVEKAASLLGIRLPRNCNVLEERSAATYLSRAEQFKVRLAFVMSMERDTMADEMQLEVDSVFTLISRLYESVGVNDLLDEDNWIQLLCKEDPVLKEKIQAYLENNATAPGKETVAYHIVTRPNFRLPET